MAGTLELQLDRYPTKPAMLTYVQTLLYSAEQAPTAVELHTDYVRGLKRAEAVLQHAPAPALAVATLTGYQAFMAAQRAEP